MPEGPSSVDPASFAAGVVLVMSAARIAAALRPGSVVRRPRTVLALLLAVTLGAVAELVRPQPLGLHLAIDPSTEPLLPAGDPGVEIYRRATSPASPRWTRAPQPDRAYGRGGLGGDATLARRGRHATFGASAWEPPRSVDP